jgi:hypothetical protein
LPLLQKKEPNALILPIGNALEVSALEAVKAYDEEVEVEALKAYDEEIDAEAQDDDTVTKEFEAKDELTDQSD